jgi:hypothetical protein
MRYHKKVVLITGLDECIVSSGYTLYRYNIQTGKKEYFSRLNDPKNALLSKCRLTRRLFRAEIRNLYHFQNDTWMCIAKKGIFRYDPTTKLFEKCCDIEKGSRPMCLCQANDGTIYYGEYCYNPTRKPMRIYQSKDNGDSWSVAYTFKQGEINHIHGLFQDPYSDKVCVATGDDDEACIFGYSEDGFETFVRKFEGTQKYRICQPLFTKDEIIFATDSQYEQNYIRSINRETGEVKDLCKIQGSGIYGAQNGNLMMVSTTVEPSTVNLDKSSHLWYSFDGHNWKELCSYEKDIWKDTYFQFGSIRFPNYEGECPYLAYNGRALKKIDQKSVFVPIKELKK